MKILSSTAQMSQFFTTFSLDTHPIQGMGYFEGAIVRSTIYIKQYRITIFTYFFFN
ncbi:unnamed protein product [Paramecium sonneborni]|uniref:Uncharacterized protein n=1 Tax=Paramecium sonneborni TaxID=65129 RepID=A0A8S1NY53_9CILI|nr:unnamed protein product [Paramecium sonneborni]